MGKKLTFHDHKIPGLKEIIPSKTKDERGAFFRTYCEEEFTEHGIDIRRWPQVNQSENKEKGTFRGLHYQLEPFEESKLVRCVRGSIVDVVVDMRPTSETYLQHEMIHLSADQSNQLFIPAGCAHGFQTLEDHTSLLYFHSCKYDPSRDAGISVFDPKLRISLPLPITSISERDKNFSMLQNTLS